MPVTSTTLFSEELKRRGLTTREIAKRLGCSRYAVRSWREARYRPSAIAHKQLAKLLRVSPTELDRLLNTKPE